MQRAKIWAVMPVKQLSLAKSRLASCLGDDRPAFAKCLMLHTFDALQASGVFDGVLVVTADTQVAALVQARGAIVVADHTISLNAACSLGLSAAWAAGADLTMIVHADLPLLSAGDVQMVLASYHAACAAADTPLLGLLRCKDGDGTNIVLCGRTTPFEPHFGPQSFARHAAGTRYCALLNENAAFDIDTEADLARLLARSDMMDPTHPIAHMLRQRSRPTAVFGCCGHS